MTIPSVLMLLGFILLVFAATGVPSRLGLGWFPAGMACWCLAVQWPALAAFGPLYVLGAILVVLLIIVILRLSNRPLI